MREQKYDNWFAKRINKDRGEDMKTIKLGSHYYNEDKLINLAETMIDPEDEMTLDFIEITDKNIVFYEIDIYDEMPPEFPLINLPIADFIISNTEALRDIQIKDNK